MNQDTLPGNSDLYEEDGFWKLRCYERPIDAHDSGKRYLPGSASVGPVSGPEGLTEREAQRIVWKNLLSCMQQEALEQQSQMTIAEFVEHRFAPQYVAQLRNSYRMYYQAILKHVLTPEEVNRVFGIEKSKSKAKLKTIQNWPYLNNLRLCDAGPENIQALISAALARGYSTQTVKHIRDVISTIFSHARQEQCFAGVNPTGPVKLSETSRKEPYSLSTAQIKEALGAMKYPEKEMMLISVFTGMKVSEICGLQWKQVNLTAVEIETDGARIPPRTMAIRKQWYRGKLETLQ